MNVTAHEPEHQIRQRAFELWQQRGNPDGYDVEFWFQAERELKSEDVSSSDSMNAPTAKSGGGSDGPA